MIEQMVKQDTWKNIRKEPPEILKRVLLCDEFGCIFVGIRSLAHDVYGNRRESFSAEMDHVAIHNIKYWRDLPEPPDECQIK